jgi:hypothetical protein
MATWNQSRVRPGGGCGVPIAAFALVDAVTDLGVRFQAFGVGVDILQRLQAPEESRYEKAACCNSS